MGDDIDPWLENLRLGKYARAFADTEIDFEVLPHLSEQDFEQIGLPLGLQLIGRAFDEETVFEFAQVLEKAASFEALPQFISETP